MARMDAVVITDLTDPFADWSQTATYTPASTGTPGTVQAILTTKEALDEAQWTAALQATADVLVLESEVADPQRNDTIEIDSVTWTVAKKTSLAGGLFMLSVHRDLRPTYRK